MKYSFAADRTLGKLAKWLRILGFDTLFESDISNKGFYDTLEPERILLTRTTKIRGQFADRRLVFIKADNLAEQLRQVSDDLAITRQDIRLFSRCLQCNSTIVGVGKEAVYGRVPDYIWQTHDKFSKCSQCERIFWAGSHVQRSREMIEKLFGMKHGEGQKTEGRRQMTEDRSKRGLNSEVGMRPPAHRGIGLRPGGKWEGFA